MVDETEFEIMDADHESRLNDLELYCPQCGEDCEELVEGYCSDCAEENQRELDLHNLQYDRWKGLTDQQREDEIKSAIR